MTNQEIATRLTTRNLGTRWTKSDTLDRVYLTDETKWRLAGLETERYGSGHISSATLNGESISNSYAREIGDALNGKIWFDVPSGKWMQKLGVLRDDVKAIVQQVVRGVKQELAQEL